MSAAAIPGGSQSLCKDCAHLRIVTSAKGSSFWRCSEPSIPMKYPPQPVVRCAFHQPADKE